jgi:predicted O-linked N-acetylglucosamine transferase (SPINDLY family)
LLTRLRFLPQLDQPDFLNVVACCDVALDSLRLGGGNVSFQCFWVGTPVIQCPTRFLRCRIAAGLYRLAGQEKWIATDWDDYAAKALQLGTNPHLRAELSRTLIQASRQRIFDQDAGVLASFDLFREWVAGIIKPA